MTRQHEQELEIIFNKYINSLIMASLEFGNKAYKEIYKQYSLTEEEMRMVEEYMKYKFQ